MSNGFLTDRDLGGDFSGGPLLGSRRTRKPVRSLPFSGSGFAPAGSSSATNAGVASPGPDGGLGWTISSLLLEGPPCAGPLLVASLDQYHRIHFDMVEEQSTRTREVVSEDRAIFSD